MFGTYEQYSDMIIDEIVKYIDGVMRATYGNVCDKIIDYIENNRADVAFEFDDNDSLKGHFETVTYEDYINIGAPLVAWVHFEVLGQYTDEYYPDEDGGWSKLVPVEDDPYEVTVAKIVVECDED